MGLPVIIFMRLKALDNPWQTHQWVVDRVEPDQGQYQAPSQLEFHIGPDRITGHRTEESSLDYWHFKGFTVNLYLDEAEGYYLNVSSPEPSWFVMWRITESDVHPLGEIAVPQRITLSYNEAGRLLDGGEQVDRVLLDQDLLASVRDYVEEYYRPEPKKRIRPASFDGAFRPKDKFSGKKL